MSNRADDLERIITHLDTLYDAGEDCLHPDTGILVSDGEYDVFRRELAKLRPNSNIFSLISASKYDGIAKKVKHHPPLTSISKASHEDREVQEEQLFKWLADCSSDGKAHKLHTLQDREYNGQKVHYPANFFYQTYKLDGVAVGLYYEKGQLVSAGLRPRKDIYGEDVTENVKYVDGIPSQLKLPLTCSIRGELICKLSDFEKVQKELAEAKEDLRANPRNHAAGAIRQFKDPTKTKLMRLTFVGYAIEGLDNPPYTTEIERAKWCNKELGVPFVQAREFNFYDLAKMEANVPNLDYEVDGVVIGVNCIEDQEQLGRHGDTAIGNPRGKIAWKFAEERAHPVLHWISWETGRTGAIKPVAQFLLPVQLAGTSVKRATLHNLGFIYRNRIGFTPISKTESLGTTLTVLKAGKIIPKVVGTNGNEVNYKNIDEVPYPRCCPSCGQKTTIKHTPAKGSSEEMFELYCFNDSCPAQNINGLQHFLTTIGVLGLGESRVTALVEGGAVKNPSDFFALDLQKAMDCNLSERQALLVIAGVHLISAPDKYDDDKLKKEIEKAKKKKKVIPLWRIFASLGIESAGKSAGKALTDHFGSFDKIRKASVAELEAVQDVGGKTAKIIHQFLLEKKDEIDELLKYIEPELPKVGPLSGVVFCLTGGFPEGKAALEKAIEEKGGKVSSSVSSKVKYVVVGTDAGSKAAKADELGIEKLDVVALKKML